MKAFIILIFALYPLAVFSQAHVYDTTGKNLQQQIEALSHKIDSVRALATAKSELLEKMNRQCSAATTAVQKAQDVTIFDQKLFIDSLAQRMAVIINEGDVVFRTMQQFDAITKVLGKALSVQTPRQKKLIDSLSHQYMALDRQRIEVQQEFDNLLIMMDTDLGTLNELNKKKSAKQDHKQL